MGSPSLSFCFWFLIKLGFLFLYSALDVDCGVENELKQVLLHDLERGKECTSVTFCQWYSKQSIRRHEG